MAKLLAQEEPFVMPMSETASNVPPKTKKQVTPKPKITTSPLKRNTKIPNLETEEERKKYSYVLKHMSSWKRYVKVWQAVALKIKLEAIQKVFKLMRTSQFTGKILPVADIAAIYKKAISDTFSPHTLDSVYIIKINVVNTI